MEWQGQRVAAPFTFLEAAKLLSKIVVTAWPLYEPRRACRSLRSLLHLVWLAFWVSVFPIDVSWSLTVHLLSLITWNWASFHLLICNLWIVLEVVSVQIFCPFVTGSFGISVRCRGIWYLKCGSLPGTGSVVLPPSRWLAFFFEWHEFWGLSKFTWSIISCFFCHFKEIFQVQSP